MTLFSEDEERIIWCALSSYKSDLISILNESVIKKNQDYKDLKLTESLIKRFTP